jgi:transposase
MNKIYHVRLEETERTQLEEVIRKGKHAARKVRRAQTLLLAAEGKTDEAISDALKVSLSTVGRTRKQCVEEGIDAALSEAPRSGRPVTLDGKGEALVVATACSAAPEGRLRWTLQLLADRIVELGVTESISTETVRQTLKKTILSPG